MWEDRYAAAGGYLFGRAAAAVLTDNPVVAVPGASALCVADGEGRNAAWLADRGLDVTAFDVSPTAVARGKALSGGAVAHHVSAWADWDFGRPFDLVVAIFVQFEGPQGRARQFADLARATRPGGRLLLHGYRPEQVALGTGGPPHTENMYTEALLRDAFSDWRVERLASYERELSEGRAHAGRSALIDFIATKPA